MAPQPSDVHSTSSSTETPVSCQTRCQSLLARSAGLQTCSNTADAVPGPDAPVCLDCQLIAACLAFESLERRIDAFNDPASPAYIEDDNVRDRATAPIEAEQAPLMERICVLRAATPEAARVRARSYLLWHKAINPAVDAAAPHRSWNDRLIAAMLRDLSEQA